MTLRIERLKDIDSKVYSELNAYARENLDDIKDRLHLLIKVTKALWAIYDGDNLQCVIGVFPTTLIGTGNIAYFFLGEKADPKKTLRFLKRAIRHYLRTNYNLTVQVANDFPQGDKFACYLGFTRYEHTYDANPYKFRNYVLRK